MVIRKKKKNSESALIKELQDNQIFAIDAGWRVFPMVFLNHVQGDKGEKLDGQTSFSPCVVQIHSDQTEEGIREAIIHEMYHIMATTVGLDPEEEDEFEIKNEDLVLQMSRASMLFHRLNPKLWEILYRDETE